MSKNNLKEFAVLMNTLADEFDKNNELSKEKVQRWKEMLLDQYGIDVLKEAVMKIIKTRKYSGFPKISEIIEAIEGSDEDIEEIALAQFQEAKKAIVRVGSYQSVEFDDPVMMKTISSMDRWPDFCRTETDKWHFKEKEFIRLYCMYYKQSKVGKLDDVPPYLPGEHSLSPSNARLGYKPRAEKIKTQYPGEITTEPENRDMSKSILRRLTKQLKGKIDNEP